MVKVNIKRVILLSAVTKPYDFDGRSGTSNKIRFLAGGDVFSVSASPEAVNDLAPLCGEEKPAVLLDVVVELASPRENLVMRLASYNTVK